MFSHLDAHPTPPFTTRPEAAAPPPGGRWAAALRRGVDVVVAFATLRDAEASDDALAAAAARIADDAPAAGAARITGDAPAAPAARTVGHAPAARIAGDPARSEPGAAPAARLADTAGVRSGGPAERRPTRGATGTDHPHRRPLRRSGSRSRRPGAVEPPAHACVTPLATSRAARRPNRMAPRA